MNQPTIKALTFDIFGTVVDWYSTIIQEGRTWSAAKGITIDWAQFALDWRGGYEPAMARVRRGELPWLNIDALHRLILDDLLVKYQITGLSEAEKDHWNRVWHRLIPWPDSIPGLTRLKARYVIAALSNGNMALLTNMAKYSGLPWDCILSAELARHYKPDPQVYQTAAALLGLPPAQVLMVAAHQHDLRGAQAVGMKTAFIPRPLEYGPGNTRDQTPDPTFDLVATDFNDLADQLGA
ncbi:MAG: haloacid dehalogenase type II [Caldilineaceae bacterium]